MEDTNQFKSLRNLITEFQEEKQPTKQQYNRTTAQTHSDRFLTKQPSPPRHQHLPQAEREERAYSFPMMIWCNSLCWHGAFKGYFLQGLAYLIFGEQVFNFQYNNQ